VYHGLLSFTLHTKPKVRPLCSPRRGEGAGLSEWSCISGPKCLAFA
jgi:hypothetical protein